MNHPNKLSQTTCALPPPNEMILTWAQTRPHDVYLRQIINREFVELTFSQVADSALRLVSALRALGAEPGDKIALISKNCAEWFICDLAMMLGDYVSVPIFPTAGSDTIEYCIRHSESKILIAGKLDDAKATTQVLEEMPDLLSIALPYPSAPQCQYQYHDLIKQHLPSEERPQHYDDKLMSLVYTSGTSGLPKGAMLTYGAFSWSVQQLLNQIGIEKEDRLFSYLPLAHITERVYVFGTSIQGGVLTAFPESLDTFIEDVKMQRPTLFISVPRLWTLFQQRIQDKLPQRKLDILLKIPLVNSLIKRKLADGLGLNKARVLGCGSAPVSPALLKWYHSVGLSITEAWGMTESFAYSTLNYPFRADKIGTVGHSGPGIRLKITDEGEILVHSKGVFSGYYKNDTATKEAFDSDGWLHTGDKGNIDADGYLTIQGRIKDTFKTAKGKFVSPVPIENKLFEYSRVEMLCLIGLGLPAPILLVVPHNFPHFDKARYERTTKKVIDKINAQLESHEQIKGVLMIKDPWSIDNGILTPTLKIKRHVLEQKYHEVGQNWPKDQLIVWEK
ncbi:AMP-binding protein [Vibrio sp. V27_P1S3P104]|nr:MULTISPECIES: AMP-binding protein [unclassified Vibrio]NAW70530.1 AMP-binding protein [Vibrio sp. V28_P6S34P95]NAX05001.1 AMP-binding protein [Vibrio sp. V30_P3S12P165]NAX35047.1 AMP-binding protein [Vibrio sp. V29_P1S30P107]NAX37725.1 AMP-binding protein [Vibrio sp. V27_P1S3P104]